MELLDELLMLYTLLAIGALVGMLALIARFYQLRSGERSRYRLFLVPLGLFALGGLYQALTIRIPGDDPVDDALLFLGGASLFGLCYLVLHLMTRRR